MHDKVHRLHLSDFPGLEEAFGVATDPRIVARPIDGKELDERTRTLNHHEAVKTAVALYLAEIEAQGKNAEQKVDV